MKHWRDSLYNLHPFSLCAIWTPLLIAQIVLAFVLQQPGIQVLKQVGWITWWLSAIFGWLPIFTFRVKGGVAKGDSFVKTTKLVTTGIYAIVRHPQMGVAGLMMNLSLMLLTQHWISVVLGIPAMALIYLDLLKADQRCIKKFGDAYRRYMERVPRVNFVLGIIQLLQEKSGKLPWFTGEIQG